MASLSLPVDFADKIGLPRLTLLIHDIIFQPNYYFLECMVSALIPGLLHENENPNLYPNNSYRRLGWVITWILAVQSALGALGAVAGSALPERLGSKQEMAGFIPVPTEDAEEQAHRTSGDSGQGTEEYSSRSPSTSTWYDDRDTEGLYLPYTNLTRNRAWTRLRDPSKHFVFKWNQAFFLSAIGVAR